MKPFRTSRSRPSPALLVAFALCFVGLRAGAEEEAHTTEDAPSLKASEVLSPKQVRGTHHRVREPVAIRGFLQRFDVESDFGLFRPRSRHMLDIRLHEIRVMAAVVNMDGGGEFAKALGKKLAQLPTAAVKIVTDPIGSLKAIGKGIGKTFKKIGGLFKKRKKTKGEDSMLADTFYGSDKRRLAAELKLDVYTSNSKVQEFLDEIAKARAAGGFTVDLATFVVPGAAGVVVSVVKYRGEVKNVLRDKSPSELHEHNRKQLTNLGIDEYLVRKFLENRKLSPRHQTVITADVVALKGVRNRRAVLEAALEARDEEGALLQERQAEMLAFHHAEVEAFTDLRAAGELVVGTTKSGSLVVMVPVDLLYWDGEARDVFEDLDSLAPKEGSKVVCLSGSATPLARKRLEARGYKVKERFWSPAWPPAADEKSK